jgi:hypothetical protein
MMEPPEGGLPDLLWGLAAERPLRSCRIEARFKIRMMPAFLDPPIIPYARAQGPERLKTALRGLAHAVQGRSSVEND